MKAVFAQRREVIVEELRKVPGFKCHMPNGAFYVFPNVTEACRMIGCKDSKELVDKLLFEAGVSVLPRTSFGVKNIGEKEEYIRLSYATSTENIVKGVQSFQGLYSTKLELSGYMPSLPAEGWRGRTRTWLRKGPVSKMSQRQSIRS